MRRFIGGFPIFCLLVSVAGCAAPDFLARSFAPDTVAAVDMNTVASASDCATASEGISLHRFDSPAGLQEWAAARKLDGLLPSELKPASYVVVELGRASNTNGFAIPRSASLTGRELSLQFSTFSREPGREPAAAPCVVVAVPGEPGWIRSVVLRDGDDNVVASTPR